jgi:uncharacterized protein YjbJ (UPF0337 family)
MSFITRRSAMRSSSVRVLGPLLLLSALAAMPLAAAHAQSTTNNAVQREVDTAWAKYKGAWTQTKGEAKEQWGKLTDNDLEEIDGRREVLVGKLQTRYAISREEAERQVGTFESRRP